VNFEHDIIVLIGFFENTMNKRLRILTPSTIGVPAKELPITSSFRVPQVHINSKRCWSVPMNLSLQCQKRFLLKINAHHMPLDRSGEPEDISDVYFSSVVHVGTRVQGVWNEQILAVLWGVLLCTLPLSSHLIYGKAYEKQKCTEAGEENCRSMADAMARSHGTWSTAV
jgi:hypothetical protein